MELIFNSSDFQDFLQNTIRQIDGEIKEENFSTDYRIGVQSFGYEFNTEKISGFFRSFGIEGFDEIGMTIWEIDLQEDLTLIRMPVEEINLLFSFIKASNIQVEYLAESDEANQYFDFSNSELTGASVASSDLYFKAHFPRNSKLQMINILIKPEKLNDYFDPKKSKWIIDAQSRPFKKQFQLSQTVSEMIDKIFMLNYNLNSYLITMKANSYMLLAQIDDHLNGLSEVSFENVNYHDVVAIGNAEKMLIESISSGEAPKTTEIAKAIGMSISKFNTIFKKVYHLSPYDYFQKYRLNYAKEMISQKKMTVSEAGRNIGYKNLSHFSEAFKKQFGVLPSEV